MAAHPPPVPPANRSPKGTGESASSSGADQKLHPGQTPENLAEQAQQGNTKQNTTNQGYQQDR